MTSPSHSLLTTGTEMALCTANGYGQTRRSTHQLMLVVEVISNSGSWILWVSSKPVTEKVTRQGDTRGGAQPGPTGEKPQAPLTCGREWLWDHFSVSFPLWPAGGAVTTEGPESSNSPGPARVYMGVHA